jgi:hypothetical protein
VDRPGAAFVLVTDQGQVYLLSSTGSIPPAPSGDDVRAMDPKEAVAFSDAPPYGSARINVA